MWKAFAKLCLVMAFVCFFFSTSVLLLGLYIGFRFLTNRSKAVRLLWIIYVISVLFLLCHRTRLFIDALWSLAGKGLTSWLSFVMSNCEVVMGQVWCLIVSNPDLCPFSYF